MSATVDVVGYNTKKQGNKIVSDYHDILQKQIDVNDNTAQRRAAYYSHVNSGISPAPSMYQNAEEEMKDTVYQQSLALASLKTFMKAEDAYNALDRLRTNDEVVEFNRYADLFMKEIAGQKAITPDYFAALWEKFNEKLVFTQDSSGTKTGIMIAATPRDLERAKDEIIDASRIDPAKLAALSIEMRKDAKFLLGEDQKALDDRFEKSVRKYLGLGPTDDIIGKEIQVPDQKGEFYTKTVNLFKGSGSYQLSSTNAASNNNKVQFMLYNKYSRPFGAKLIWTGDPKTAIVPPAQSGVFRSLTPSQLARSTIAGYPAVTSVPVSASSASTPPAASASAPGSALTSPTAPSGVGLMAARKYDPHNHFSSIYGAGLAVDYTYSDSARSSVAKTSTGRGKLQANFGRLHLSPAALEKSTLTLRHPSTAPVRQIPRTPISSNMKRILNSILYEGTFDENDYKALEEDERKLFDDIVDYAKADTVGEVRLFKHKKYHDDARDTMVKRFNTLKAEIIAGNDSPGAIKEMKCLLFKMLDNRIIQRAEFNRLLAQLVAMS